MKARSIWFYKFCSLMKLYIDVVGWWFCYCTWFILNLENCTFINTERRLTLYHHFCTFINSLIVPNNFIGKASNSLLSVNYQHINLRLYQTSFVDYLHQDVFRDGLKNESSLLYYLSHLNATPTVSNSIASLMSLVHS